LGSKRLMRNLSESGAPFACVNIDSVGRLADGRLYVLNTDSAREWRFIFMGVGYTTGAPVSVVAEPLDSSDQMSCIEVGVPAVQLFTGPHADYHRPSDTVDTIDAEGMAIVTEAAHEAVAYLAERSDALTVTIEADPSQERAQGDGGPRRASLGTMPDFGFEGRGVRVQQVMEGSAAEAAGVRAGDVVVAIDDETVEDLRGYSKLLKKHAPGDTVQLKIVRDGTDLTLTAVLGTR
jgi:membrane-associated protease RseP (regulator of RpoE activity)